MSTIANAKVEHNYNRYNGYFFGCLQTIPNYCFFEKKPAIEVEFINDGQLTLF